MPTLKVKTVYIEKLKALGVYDAWMTNVKADYSNNIGFFINGMENAGSWWGFLSASFAWTLSMEGDSFWREISNS